MVVSTGLVTRPVAHYRGLTAAAALLAVAACSKDTTSVADRKPAPAPSPTPTPAPAPAPTPAPAHHWYRGVFVADKLPELPVYFDLPAPGTTGTGKMVSGQHEAEFAAGWTGTALTMDFPIFHAAIKAVADDHGALAGKWDVTSKTWGASSLAFKATPVAEPSPQARFDEASLPGAPIDLGAAGAVVWKVAFPESGVAKLELEQVEPGVFNATMLFPTGNVVYLAGNGRGHQLRLSSLIGLSLYLLDADVDAARKTLTGTWVAGPNLAWREKFKATRATDFDVHVIAATTGTRPKLALPLLAAYHGKPLIVEIGGSWCDACKHAAAALRDIYDRYHPRGLEIVSLTYEFTSDTAYNKRQAETFKKDYRIPWEVIAVDGEVDSVSKTMPQGIEGIDASAFPITLFVERDDTIHSVHASFAGPENAKEHRKWLDEYDAQTAAIVGGDPKPK